MHTLLLLATLIYGGFRGPDRNGVFPDKGLNGTNPKLLWQSDQLGFGWGSACVTPDTVYCVGTPTSAKTKKPGDPVNSGFLFAFGHDGQLKWKKPYGPEIGGRWPGPRATPMLASNLVIVASAEELFTAFRADTGDVVWTLEPQKVFRSEKQGYHGSTGSPLIAGDRLLLPLCSRANDVPSFVALDLATGKMAWTSVLPACTTGLGWSRGDTSPTLVTTPQRQVLVCHLWRCIAAVDARDGKFLWNLPATAGASFTPVQSGQYLLLEENLDKKRATMMMRVAADGSVKELWKKPGLAPSFPHAVILDEKVFFFQGANLVCADAATGNALQELPAGGRAGAVIAADGLVFWQVGVPAGGKGSKIKIAVTKPTPKGMEPVGAFDTPVRCDSDPPWVHPVIAGGRLYVRFHAQTAVYDLK